MDDVFHLLFCFMAAVLRFVIETLLTDLPDAVWKSFSDAPRRHRPKNRGRA